MYFIVTVYICGHVSTHPGETQWPSVNKQPKGVCEKYIGKQTLTQYHGTLLVLMIYHMTYFSIKHQAQRTLYRHQPQP